LPEEFVWGGSGERRGEGVFWEGTVYNCEGNSGQGPANQDIGMQILNGGRGKRSPQKQKKKKTPEARGEYQSQQHKKEKKREEKKKKGKAPGVGM